MLVVKVELDGVVTHWCGAGDLDDVFSMNGKGVGCHFHCWRSVPASRARATLAQIGVGIGGFVPVTPLHEHTTGRGKFDGGRSCVHEAFNCEDGTGLQRTEGGTAGVSLIPL